MEPIRGWDEYGIEIAKTASRKSKDRSTKIGCCLLSKDGAILSVGYNGIPKGCKDDIPQRHERPKKYLYFEHSERNAIYNAARNGIRTLDCTAYVTAPPCGPCSRALINSGICRVVVPINHSLVGREDWKESFDVAQELFSEAKVIFNWYK